jgi:replicative DNA helicase
VLAGIQLLPESIQAEACVLGTMILHPSSIDLIVQIVKACHFVRPSHRALFRMLVDMHAAGKKIDLATVWERIRARGQTERVGGIDYVVSLAEGVPDVANAEYYARVVRDKFKARKAMTR